MRAYLAQHGLAKDGNEDAERSLSGRGRKDVARCAGFLGRVEKPEPVRIVHSGKLRARQSAEIFAGAWVVIPVSAMPNRRV